MLTETAKNMKPSRNWRRVCVRDLLVVVASVGHVDCGPHRHGQWLKTINMDIAI